MRGVRASTFIWVVAAYRLLHTILHETLVHHARTRSNTHSPNTHHSCNNTPANTAALKRWATSKDTEKGVRFFMYGFSVLLTWLIIIRDDQNHQILNRLVKY
jgi:hypothetical protein